LSESIQQAAKGNSITDGETGYATVGLHGACAPARGADDLVQEKAPNSSFIHEDGHLCLTSNLLRPYGDLNCDSCISDRTFLVRQVV
jgi:hypothetical protein